MDRFEDICKDKELAVRLVQRIHSKSPWVLYHSPLSDSVTLLLPSSDDVQTYLDWGQLPLTPGYLIAPFALTQRHPIVFIKTKNSKIRYSYTPISASDITNSIKQLEATPSLNYKKNFTAFIEALNTNLFDKLVLARTYTEHYAQRPPLIEVFSRALTLYPAAYTYMLYTPQTGLWIGSTPELLLSGSEKNYRTMSLAGTLPYSEPIEELPWSSRHRDEQAYVTYYITEALASLGIASESSPSYSVRSGQIAHLRTDITFSLPEHIHIGKLLGVLHPTPAVCGLPKAESKAFILENESICRSYYSGCLGLINQPSEEESTESAVYVNLRCMELQPSSATLYAGGGLLPSSTLHDEWLETERKLQTIRAIIL